MSATIAIGSLRRLIYATFLSNTGSAMSVLALGSVLYSHTGSAAGFAIAFVAEQVAQLCGMFLAGPVVDTRCPRRIAIWADMVRGVAFVLSAIALYFELIELVFLCSVAGGFCKPFHRASVFRWVPEIIGDQSLTAFNASYGSAVQLGALLGTGLGGLALTSAPPALLIGFDGISYFVSALSLTALPSFVSADAASATREQAKKTSKNWLGTLRKALGLDAWSATLSKLYHRPILALRLLASAGDYLVIAVFNVFLMPFVLDTLRGATYFASILDGGFAAGALLGTFFCGRNANLLEKEIILVGCVALSSLGFFLMGASTNLALASVGGALLGAASRVTFVENTTSLQKSAAPDERGRIAVIRMGCVSALSALIVAPAASFVGKNIFEGYYFGGALVLVFGALSFASRRKAKFLERAGAA